MTVRADRCRIFFCIIAYHGASDSMFRTELDYQRWWNSIALQVVIVLYCVAVIVYWANLIDALTGLV